jgi:hypothetical protein
VVVPATTIASLLPTQTPKPFGTLHDAADREQHQVKRLVVARDRDTQSRHSDRHSRVIRVPT